MSRSETSDASARSTQLDFIANFCVQPHSDSKAYKRDKKCYVCFELFSVAKQKKYCKFCYRAVCTSCSKREALHPQKNQRSRLCDNCYRRGMEEHIKQDFEKQLMKEMSEVDTQEELLRNQRKLNISKTIHVNELKEKYQRMSAEQVKREDEHRNQIEDLNREISYLQNDGVQIKKELEKKKFQLEKRESKIKVTREELESITEKQTEGSCKIENLQELINCQYRENKELKEKLNYNGTENYQQICQQQNLPILIQKLNDQIQKTQMENKNIGRQISELLEQKDCKKCDISLLNQQIEKKRNFAEFIQQELGAQADFSGVIQYFAQIAANQDKQLQKMKKHFVKKNKTLPKSDEATPARGRCHCLIQ